MHPTPQAIAHFQHVIARERAAPGCQVIQAGPHMAIICENRGDLCLSVLYVKGDEVRRGGYARRYPDEAPACVLIGLRELANHALADLAGGHIGAAVTV